MSKLLTVSGSLIESFPYSLSRDKDKYNIAEAVSEKLAAAAIETEKAKIYPIIDNLPEGVLDILAYDFKVEWYDYSAPLKNKRKVIKECILVHKYKGTKYAVETALKSLYPVAKVSEWFEYGGMPYHFKVTIWDDANDIKKCKLVIQKINYYKNVRSILEETTYIVSIGGKARVFYGAAASGKKKSIYCQAKKFEVWQHSEASAKVHGGTKVTSTQTKKHILTAREV